MNVTIQPASRSAEELMRRVLRDGGELAPEYPLVFDPAFGGRVVALEDEDGGVVSACALLARELVIGERRVRAGFIGSVATAPEHRGRGHATRALLAAEAELTARGCALAMLWADEPGFYARLGYLPMGAEHDFMVTPASARHLPDPAGARPAKVTDAPLVHGLYELHTERVARTAAETAALLGGPGIDALVLERAGLVVAYACLGRGADFASVIHEWGGTVEDVFVLVRAHLERRGESEPLFVMAPPSAIGLAEAFEEAGVPGARGVLGLGKLLHGEAVASLLASVAGEAATVAVTSSGALRVTGPGGSLELSPENALLTLFAPKAERDVVAVVEGATGLALAELPLMPFVWGLDSI